MRPACFLSKKQVKRDFRWLVRICCLGELIRGLQNLESPFEKVLILFVRSRHCGELNRGLQNLDSPFGKVLILFVGSRHCGELNRGLQNLEAFRKGTDLFFSLVRKEPKVPQRFANIWTPGTIQISARYMAFAKVTGHHHVTGRSENRKVSGYRR